MSKGRVLDNGFLSLSQIHRLLRPLRTKIEKLSNALNNAKNKPTKLPPCTAGLLAILPHPSRLQSRAFRSVDRTWDASSQMYNIPIIELSRMVYDVTVAFKNVVSRAYGDELVEGGRSRVRPLMEICAAIIGDDIEASVMELLGDGECSSSDSGEESSDDEDDEDEEDSDSDDDDDGTYVVDGCYEQIPQHLRRWVLVPHALQMILMHIPTCVPTLLETCLDIALEFGASREAFTILKRLLHFSLSRRDGAIPIKSSHHDDYLIHLLQKPTSPSTPLTNSWCEPQYIDVLVGCLTSKTEEAWCSAAIQRLYDGLTEDGSRIQLALGLCRSSALARNARRRLRGWVTQILKSTLERSTLLGSEVPHNLPELCGALMDVACSQHSGAEGERLRDASVCLLTHVLHQGGDTCSRLLDLLRDMAPLLSAGSFDPLVDASEELATTLSAHVTNLLPHAEVLRRVGLETSYLECVMNSVDDILEGNDDPGVHDDESNAAVDALRKALRESNPEVHQAPMTSSPSYWKTPRVVRKRVLTPDSDDEADEVPIFLPSARKRRRIQWDMEDSDSEAPDMTRANTETTTPSFETQSLDEEKMDEGADEVLLEVAIPVEGPPPFSPPDPALVLPSNSRPLLRLPPIKQSSRPKGELPPRLAHAMRRVNSNSSLTFSTR